MKKLFALSCLLFAACGSSSEPVAKTNNAPTQPAGDDAGAVQEDSGAQAAVRSLKQGHLLPSAPQNLILDATFRDQGWGHFLLVSGAQNAMASRAFSASPAGPSIPVGVLKDPTSTDDKSKSINCLTSFLGGKGPFAVGVWVSRNSVSGAPMDFPDDGAIFRATVTQNGATGKDLKRTVSQTIAGRTWWRYELSYDQEVPVGYFSLRVGTKGGAIWVQAPEIIPVAALPADKTMSLPITANARALEADEIEAVAAYKRQPIQLMLPKLPPLMPGRTTPLD